MKTKENFSKKFTELYTLEVKDDKEFADSNGTIFSGSRNKCKAMDKVLDELRDFAIKFDTLVGRTIKFPHADSFALYIITKVNKKTVRLTWIDYMDGWQDDRLGAEGTVSIDFAETKVTGEDRMLALFAKKKEVTA